MGRLRHRRRPRVRKRWVILASGVVIAVGAGGGGWLATRGSAAPAPAYQLVAAVSGTLRQTASSTGTIQPARQANLNFAASGEVTSVAVKVGQKVAAGQVLATVSSASLAGNLRATGGRRGRGDSRPEPGR
jgi:membrane fusion protein, macrolide-specific efflux system